MMYSREELEKHYEVSPVDSGRALQRRLEEDILAQGLPRNLLFLFSQKVNKRLIQSNYTIQRDDLILLVDTSKQSVIITLPRAQDYDGRWFYVVDAGRKAATNNILFATSDSSEILTDYTTGAKINTNSGIGQLAAIKGQWYFWMLSTTGSGGGNSLGTVDRLYFVKATENQLVNPTPTSLVQVPGLSLTVPALTTTASTRLTLVDFEHVFYGGHPMRYAIFVNGTRTYPPPYILDNPGKGAELPSYANDLNYYQANGKFFTEINVSVDNTFSVFWESQLSTAGITTIGGGLYVRVYNTTAAEPGPVEF